MQTATILSKLDYGYLIQPTNDTTDSNQPCFLESSANYPVNTTINILKSSDKYVDHPILHPNDMIGFNIVQCLDTNFTCNNTNIILSGPIHLSKFTAVYITKSNQFYVAKVLTNDTNLPISHDDPSIVTKHLLSLNINHLHYFTNTISTPSHAIPKYPIFCKLNNLQYMQSHNISYFQPISNTSATSHMHIMPYGLLSTNAQFLNYSQITRNTPSQITITSKHMHSKACIGYWATINNQYKAFLPIHHINNTTIKIGSMVDCVIWDIQQDTIIVTLHLSLCDHPPFPSLLHVKHYLLQATSIQTISRSIDKQRSQCDFYGIRAYINGSFQPGQIVQVTPSGTIHNIVFKSHLHRIPLPQDYTPSLFTCDIPTIPTNTLYALYGPPLLIKPMITEPIFHLIKGHTIPLWITNITKTHIFLTTFQNNQTYTYIAYTSTFTVTIGQTVLGVILHDNIVSLKWSLIVKSILLHGFTTIKTIKCDQMIPNKTATLCHHMDTQYVGHIVMCHVHKVVDHGVYVGFTCDGRDYSGFIQLIDNQRQSAMNGDTIRQSTIRAMIMTCDTALFDLVPVSAAMSDACKIAHLTPHYAICLFKNTIGYLPLSNLNYTRQHDYSIGQHIHVEAHVVDGIQLLQIATRTATILQSHVLEYYCKVGKTYGTLLRIDAPLHYKNGDTIDVDNVMTVKKRVLLNTNKTPIMVNSVVTGIITHVQQGVFVQLRYNITGRIKIRDLSDHYVKEWRTLVRIGEMVTVRVMTDQYDLSMKYSDIHGIDISRVMAGIEIGMIVAGCVVFVKNNRIKVALKMGQPDGIEMCGVVDGVVGVVKGQGVQCKIKSVVGRKIMCDVVTDMVTEDMVTEEDDMSTISTISDISMASSNSVTNATNAMPTTRTQFEPIREYEMDLIAHPNESMYYIQYMGKVLMAQGILYAIGIWERGIKQIRGEEDVMNMYKAVLTMVYCHGDITIVRQMIERGLGCQNRLMIYTHCIGLIETYGDRDGIMREMEKRVLKEYKWDRMVWLLLVKYEFGKMNLERGREMFQKSLLSVDKTAHLEHIIDYSMIEYKMGDKERCRTIISGILVEYPKRLDVWGKLVDLEIANGFDTNVAHLFETIVAKDCYKMKQMKYIYEKWIGFEEMRGDLGRVERVREMAGAYLKKRHEGH